MSVEEFPASPDFEPDAKEEEEAPVEEEAAINGPIAEEDIELEPSIEAIETEEQEVGDDPVRLYLHEIGRVQLLTADNEKTIARKIEMGKRIAEVKRELVKQGKHTTASMHFWSTLVYPPIPGSGR
jgi:RNA polymerase primary sigma factor